MHSLLTTQTFVPVRTVYIRILRCTPFVHIAQLGSVLELEHRDACSSVSHVAASCSFAEECCASCTFELLRNKIMRSGLFGFRLLCLAPTRVTCLQAVTN